MASMTFDPFAKKRTDCPEEVQESNYRNVFVTYCGKCMEDYGLQAGKLANRRVGECGICGKSDEFLVGNMSADSNETQMALCHFGDDNQPGEDIS
jgi:hypothetical protein